MSFFFVGRFYGHIALSSDQHDSDTLEAIRETAPGLEGISVERIWMEMKKILIGNHAPHIVKLMYELQVSKYIGEKFLLLFCCIAFISLYHSHF